VRFASAPAAAVTVLAGPVSVVHLRALDRELRAEVAGGSHLVGPTAAIVWDARGLQCWLRLRLTAAPASRPAMVAIPGPEAPDPGEGAHARGVHSLAAAQR
jgi:hypothetical protein